MSKASVTSQQGKLAARARNSERQKRFSTRSTEAGNKRLCVWIDRETQEALSDICKRTGETQGNVVSLLITQAANIMRSNDNE